MNVFSQPTVHSKRLRDYGAFQNDLSLLDTLTTTAAPGQERKTESLSPEYVPPSGKGITSFTELTTPYRKLPKHECGIRKTFLLRVQKAISHKWPAIGVRLCITFLLFVCLLRSFSWRTVLTAMTHVHMSNLLIGLVIGSSGIVLSAYQWHVLLRSQRIHFDLADLIKLYMVGITFSHFLPTGFGGDAFKSFYVGRKSHNGEGAVSATIMCRITGFVAMLVLVVPVLLIFHQTLPFLLTLAFVLLCLLGCATIAGILVFALLLPRLSKKRSWLQRFLVRIVTVGAILHKSILMSRPMLSAISYGILFWLVAILNCSVYADTLGIHTQLAFYFLTVPLIAMVVSLPVSLNGFGLREGAFVYALSFIQVPSEKAILLVFLLDLQSLFFALLGCGIYFTLGNGKRKTLLKTCNSKQ